MRISVTCWKCRASLQVREDFAGKQVKCGRCGSVNDVPQKGAEAEEAVEAVVAEPEASAQQALGVATRPCPECGEPVAVTARKCRHCKAWLEEDEDDDRGPSYVPCPRCGRRGAKRVVWTFWGSFYGPAIFNHVRCPRCGYAYNGRTGSSNLIPAIIFVAVPAVLLLAICGGLVYAFVSAVAGGK